MIVFQPLVAFMIANPLALVSFGFGVKRSTVQRSCGNEAEAAAAQTREMTLLHSVRRLACLFDCPLFLRVSAGLADECPLKFAKFCEASPEPVHARKFNQYRDLWATSVCVVFFPFKISISYS